MRVPYFKAKDKDSDIWVEGFYVEYPEHSDFNQECKLVHAIMVVVPNAGMGEMLGMLSGFANGNPSIQQMNTQRNTLNICTIDMSTLQQIGEVEIGEKLFKPETWVKNPNSSIIL